MQLIYVEMLLFVNMHNQYVIEIVKLWLKKKTFFQKILPTSMFYNTMHIFVTKFKNLFLNLTATNCQKYIHPNFL